MGLPRARATEQRVSSEPARDSRADESMDASFMQQLQQKLKTPKGLSKEILTQLGLRGAARGVAQPGGRPGEETKSVEHIQQAQAGALSQVTHLLTRFPGKGFRPSFRRIDRSVCTLCLGTLIDAGR